MFDYLGARQMILTLQWFALLMTIITDTPRFLLRGSLTLPLREPVRYTGGTREHATDTASAISARSPMLRALISMVDSSIQALAITLGQGYASMVALMFALVGAYAGALVERRLKLGS